ncbi:hypothetical protein PTTG_29085 [Puccinia triticina 1-1 BBBD Race 1]|uniref:Uncharacterized protein n=1 Tax=Puccinia triticina (isolate 1-1 / race 1 (BBBD)) TaxID=630390 RepID=A0A180G6N7_PUCT1|nr:hypothetical protein PTTG_29085 [Puccinia triticina 1-1 BBBD Race 1]
MPAYKGPIKGVKIKPLDKELCFDGTNITIENFINMYENVGSTDGASSIDLVRQVVSFLKGEAIKEEVEQMEAYRNQNWEDLKKQLLDRYGSPLPLVRYTRRDLTQLVNNSIQAGGIKTSEDFRLFNNKYSVITNDLLRMKQCSHLEEFREFLLDALSPELESAVTKELIKCNEMLASEDGGMILPLTATIFSFIVREVHSASVMERRKLFKMALPQDQKDSTLPVTKAPPSASQPMAPPSRFQPQTTISQAPKSTDQKLEEITKQLAALSAGNSAPPHLIGTNPGKQHTPSPRKNPDFKCFYCFQNTHRARKCAVLNYDIEIGSVIKDGNQYKLPDNSTIPWDTSRPIKPIVDQFSKDRISASPNRT